MTGACERRRHEGQTGSRTGRQRPTPRGPSGGLGGAGRRGNRAGTRRSFWPVAPGTKSPAPAGYSCSARHLSSPRSWPPLVIVHNRMLSDPVLQGEMDRQFAASEFRAALAGSDAQSILRCLLCRQFQVFAVQAADVLALVADGSRVDAGLPGRVHRFGRLRVSSARPAGWTMAGDDRGVVLAPDRVLHLLDRIRPVALRRLASVDPVGRRWQRAANKPFRSDLACPGDMPSVDRRRIGHRPASAVGIGVIRRVVLHRRVRPAVLHVASLADRGGSCGRLGLGNPPARLACCRCSITCKRAPAPDGAAAEKKNGPRSGWKRRLKSFCPTCTAPRKKEVGGCLPSRRKPLMTTMCSRATNWRVRAWPTPACWPRS